MNNPITATSFTIEPSVLADLRMAAIAAGRETLRVRQSGDLGVRQKEDDSPVTRADEAANDIILDALERLCPGVPVVSEESPFPELDPTAPFFLIDPVDGTKTFVKGGDEFTVNIGLVDHREPIAGIIFAPATGQCYWTTDRHSAVFEQWDDQSSGFEQRPLRATPNDSRQRTALVSKSYLNQSTIDWLDRRDIQERRSIGSSLKLALLADGEAVCYPRLSPIWEWDTAAGHAILNAVGGTVLDATGTGPLQYGKPDFKSDGFLAFAQGIEPDEFSTPGMN